MRTGAAELAERGVRKHLGPFSDWVEFARGRDVAQPAPAGPTRGRLGGILGFRFADEQPREVIVDASWERDGIAGQEVSWSVGFGPRTRARVLRPAGETGPLPGVIALHDHGGFKFHGLEKISDGPEPSPDYLRVYRERYYGGRAWADELARSGFTVVAHDTFCWGSRRFPLDAMPHQVREVTDASRSLWDDGAAPSGIARYNAAAGHHEHVVEKYCNLLGTTMAGVVSYEDRVALNYLLSRPDVDGTAVGCAGLSGGGARSALLLATHDAIAAAVIVGMMTTYDALLDSHVADHTWMFYPSGWAGLGDWPELAASRAPLPLLVQYDRHDELFTEAGMRAAHEALGEHYAAAGGADAYRAEFYDGPHRFDIAMQQAAFSWLADALG